MEDIKELIINHKALTIIIAIIVIIGILLLGTIKIVRTGEVGVKTKFGIVEGDVLNEGIHLKTPFIEKINKINIKTQKYSNDEDIESSTKDLQVVNSIKITINYNVNKEKVKDLFSKVGNAYKDVILLPAIEEATKSEFSQYSANELATKREEVSTKIKDKLNEKLNEQGLEISSISINNFDFSEEYNNAIEQKAIAQQNVEKSRAELEQANVDNEKKIKNAEAEAKVIQLQREQLTEEYLKHEAIQKWNGALPTTTTEDVLKIIQ